MKHFHFILFTLVAACIVWNTAQAQQTATTSTTAPVTRITTVSSTPSILSEGNDPWALSVQGGGLWSTKDNSRLHRGGEITVRGTYDVTPYTAVGLESGILGYTDRTNGVRYGRLYGVPLMANLTLKCPIPAMGNRLVPYVYAAAGAVFWNYDKSHTSDATGVSAPERTSWAAKPGVGLEYDVTPNVAVFVEGSYMFTGDYRLKDGSSSPPNGKLHPDGAYGGVGLKIAF